MSARRQNQPLASGSRAPDFRLPALEGGEASLADLAAGGPVVLAFFKTSCPVCQFTLPILSRIHTPGTLPIYGISQNDAESTRDFLRQFGVAIPVLLDDEDDGFLASNGFGISTVPTLFLVERDGAVARTIEGWSRKDIQWLAGRAGVNPFRAGEYVPEWKAG